MFSIFDIASSGMHAQSVRLNLTASNLANAESIGGPHGEAYRARHPLFQTVLAGIQNGAGGAGVQVSGIVEDSSPLPKRHDPGNPLADAAGYIELPNVNPVAEMANMMAASRAYQNNADVLNAGKQMMLRTLQLGA